MQVQSYLNFNGRCEEAVEFYRSALGAEVTMLMRFKDMPPSEIEAANEEGCMPPSGSENKIMHVAFQIGETTILASDCNCDGQPSNFQGISLALDADGPAEAERIYNALADGGQAQMPLTETFFASRFGMVEDRFGVSWMVLATAK